MRSTTTQAADHAVPRQLGVHPWPGRYVLGNGPARLAGVRLRLACGRPALGPHGDGAAA